MIKSGMMVRYNNREYQVITVKKDNVTIKRVDEDDSCVVSINDVVPCKLSVEYTQRFWEKFHKRSSFKHLTVETTKKRSELLVRVINKLGSHKDISILEVGSNLGRNLNELFNAGYTNLSAIEICPAAIEQMKKLYPAMYEKSNIMCGAAEDILPTLNEKFDVVFSMAVLMHIHPDSIENICREMNRLSKYIIVFESEPQGKYFNGNFNWSRNYENIFCSFGTKIQIKKLGPKKMLEAMQRDKYVGRIFAEKYLCE